MKKIWLITTDNGNQPVTSKGYQLSHHIFATLKLAQSYVVSETVARYCVSQLTEELAE